MAIIIKPYVRKLIKDNLIYIVVNIFLVGLTTFFLIIKISELPEKQTKISSLKSEVAELENKYKILNLSEVVDAEKLDSDINTLNMLIPNSEDYFSIVYALEQLSKKTNFIINSYSINLKNSSKDKMQLVISGTGDQVSFLDFLKQYNFGGGRLITADKIELSAQFFGTIKLNINLYTKAADTNSNAKLVLTKQQLDEIESIKTKINLVMKDTGDEEVDLNYPKKVNPF